MSYLERMDLFAPELRARVGDKFDELDQLVHDQDQVLDQTEADWLDVWLDNGCRGYEVVGDFVQAEEELWNAIPDEGYVYLNTIVGRILDILRCHNHHC